MSNQSSGSVGYICQSVVVTVGSWQVDLYVVVGLENHIISICHVLKQFHTYFGFEYSEF